jgi:hypothetical protein
MKSNKLFLIKALSETKDADIMIREFANCFDDGDEENFKVEEVNGIDYIFLRMPEYKIEKLCGVLDKYIEYSLEDITQRIILGSEDELSEVINSEDFKSFFTSFRIDSTNIDDVLDKIIEKGIDSLDEIDKIILSKK